MGMERDQIMETPYALNPLKDEANQSHSTKILRSMGTDHEAKVTEA